MSALAEADKISGELEKSSEPAPAPDSAAAEGASEEAGNGAGEGVAEEESSTAVFKPLVTLDEVEVATGEEEEDSLFQLRGKLYRYTETLLDKGSGKKQWIERGVGEIKLLKNRESQQQRFLMRQEKTLKIIVNTLIDPRIRMTKMDSNEKTWVWSCYDFSEGEIVEEVFAFKCPNVEDAATFKSTFDKSQKEMEALLAGADAPPDAEADSAADALKSLAT